MCRKACSLLSLYVMVPQQGNCVHLPSCSPFTFLAQSRYMQPCYSFSRFFSWAIGDLWTVMLHKRRKDNEKVLQAMQGEAVECCWCLTFLPPSLLSLSPSLQHTHTPTHTDTHRLYALWFYFPFPLCYIYSSFVQLMFALWLPQRRQHTILLPEI